jgi:hypothetical protein
MSLLHVPCAEHLLDKNTDVYGEAGAMMKTMKRVEFFPYHHAGAQPCDSIE